MTITLTREEAQQVLDALKQWKGFKPEYWEEKDEKAIETLRTRLAQPEPEPVAWYVRFDSGRADLLTSPITEARRAMWESAGKRFTVTPLYTAPPQREWQGLTDEEIMSLLPGAVRLPPGWSETVRAIEAKLKEKNS